MTASDMETNKAWPQLAKRIQHNSWNVKKSIKMAGKMRAEMNGTSKLGPGIVQNQNSSWNPCVTY